jgi:hypothetical protein
MLVNGTFEQGPNVGWLVGSLRGYQIILHQDNLPITPYAGNWAAWLGGLHDEIAIIQQTVTVPPQDPTLRFYYLIGSSDVCGYDFGGVIVNGETVVDAFDLCSTTSSTQWRLRTVNLPQYAGQTIELQIRIETDDLLNSNLFVDNVSLGGVVIASPEEPMTSDHYPSGVMMKSIASHDPEAVAWPQPILRPVLANGERQAK